MKLWKVLVCFVIALPATAAELHLLEKYPEGGQKAEYAMGMAIAKGVASQQGKGLRGTHAKGICTSASLKVLDVSEHLPAAAVGLYQQPGVYFTEVRFANGSAKVQSDLEPDVRSLSMKIYVSEDQKVDLSSNDDPVFAFSNALSFISFFKGASGAELTESEKQMFNRSVGLIQRQKKPAIPFQVNTYHSQVPVASGAEHAARISAEPCSGNSEYQATETDNFLQESLKVATSGNTQCFKIYLNVLDPDNELTVGEKQELVEDASSDWSESAPVQKVQVALLNLNPVSYGNCDPDISFNVNKNTFSENKPIGGINRIRSLAEEMSKDKRSQE